MLLSCSAPAKNFSILCPYNVNLSQTEFQNNRPINLTEEISTLYSIQAVAWPLLSVFSQSFIEIRKNQSGGISKLCSLHRKGT